MKQLICPVCGQNPRLLFAGQRRIFLCPNCGLRFAGDGPGKKNLYQQNYWKQVTSRQEKSCGYTDYLAEEEVLKKYFRDLLAQVGKLLPNSGRVLDVGCSFGFFLEVAREKGDWQTYGVDLSAEAVASAKKRLKTKNIFLGSLNQARFPNDYFDLITVFQTLEHVTDPVGLLKEAGRVLRPGGIIVITTPDAESWLAKLMGKSWFSYRHLDHLLFFNYESLSYSLKKAGFKKIQRLKDPPYWHRLDYLLNRAKYYQGNRFLLQSNQWLGSWLKVKVPIPLPSVVVKASK